MSNKFSRRGFLKTTITGGTAALLTACNNDPVEELIPFLIPPDDFVPGKSIHFATVCKECPAQCGMVIRTREGRAVKAEGNPLHPTSKGGLCAVGQASLQGLYHPRRVRGPFQSDSSGNQLEITWEQGLTQLISKIKEIENGSQKKKILYLTRPDSGSLPTLLDQLISQLSTTKKLVYDLSPLNSISTASDILFGKKEIPLYHFDKAQRLINFGADFMESWLNPVESIRGYSEGQLYSENQKNRYLHIAPYFSLTGTNADKQITCRPDTETEITLSLAYLMAEKSKVISDGERSTLLKSLKEFHPDKTAMRTGFNQAMLREIAAEIGTDGSSLVIAGGNVAAGKHQTQLQTAGLLLNYLAGNVGRTVEFGTETSYRQTHLKELDDALNHMMKGEVGLVVSDNVNPAYSYPDKTRFQEALKKVDLVVSLSTLQDETSDYAHLHLPVSHFLESWGDSIPRNGTYAIQQPVMSTVPGYQTMQAGDLLLNLGKGLELKGFDDPSFFKYLKRQWKNKQAENQSTETFESLWKDSIQKGGLFKPFKPDTVKLLLKSDWIPKPSSSKADITLLPVNSVFHNANGYNGDKYWLLEVPEPVSQAVWEPVAMVHPLTAKRLGIRNKDLIRIDNKKGRSISIAAVLYHGISENAVAVFTGFGRKLPFPDYTHFKRDLLIPTKTSDPKRLIDLTPGVNPLDLMDAAFDTTSGDLVLNDTHVIIKPEGRKSNLVTADGHYRASKGHEQKEHELDLSQKNRDLIQFHGGEKSNGSHKEKRHHKERYHSTNRGKRNLYPAMEKSVSEHPYNLTGRETEKYYESYRWELVIDLDRCTGCSSCVVSCYAENNIAVVGKERQAVGREMSWLRLERYFDQNEQTGKLETNFSPQMCSQCENAGCEPVCPLYATYHNPDGINTMIYARCAGTRYCANNCIYKSRKFNWRTYVFPSPLHLQLNPDVTVRDKGVMEKCTFCIQRIKEAKELAKLENRLVREGEIQTACQQSCPANAISFGNSRDPESRVSKLKQDPRAYQQLPELNFKPAITYLKKVRKS